MDGGVDSPLRQRRLDFLCEQALAADIGQPAVEYPVAGGADDRDLDIEARLARPQCGGRLFRLPESEPAAARAETDFRHGQRVTPSGRPAQSAAAPADGRKPPLRGHTGPVSS